MKNLDYRECYRRNLPHVQPRGATFLVNFRLAGSLPKTVIEHLREEKDKLEEGLLKIEGKMEKWFLRENGQQELFVKWDDALHDNKVGRSGYKMTGLLNWSRTLSVFMMATGLMC